MTIARRSLLQAGIATGAFSLFGQGPSFAAGPNIDAKLIAAAKKEGMINVIALPRDWANWGSGALGYSEQ